MVTTAKQIGGDAVFEWINSEELVKCNDGDELVLWSKPHLDFIRAYRDLTFNERKKQQSGTVLSMLKYENKELGRLIDLMVPVWIEVRVNPERTRYELTVKRGTDEEGESNRRHAEWIEKNAIPAKPYEQK
ncbi:hypothetical protein LH427_03785 [Laribacter hongkongensis]|uniref:hypothetical protein n=1 Tax=Laribacter hongkongensis TaxID=168471 RepID=UPI001EFEC7E8|nr:hypothetical protein [Laribacter hongkongensis]MCG8990884.1 hypothetical protein [Laribacter hongkongensis]MCG8997048.1 hypothetical protein [Laribacter hongkongensis]MCG9001870.1 hypothetical protein [Laribacter hongkongensis]MCG9003539.1 hypothetical protein [Laribacter hongkongensis]MCG9008182.1 hypothetical protein [Laribacter hongkongensis]